MNITSLNSAPIPTVVNPQTDSLRRENNHRETIAKPAAASQSAAEKGVASERERGRTPAQNNESIDFANIRKQAEVANSTIADDHQHADQQDSQKNNSQQDAKAEEKHADDDSHAVKEFSEQQEIKGLQQRDREVRSHELAHASVGGAATGSPSYSFQVGPDGKKYAVEGEVSVDLSTVKGNPRATIAKMQKVYNAALAPANPSIQDTRVASSAAQLIAQAQSELLANPIEGELDKANKFTRVISPNGSLTGQVEKSLEEEGSDFDTLINHTLKAQEDVSPSRSVAVDQRALRIENFYSNINQAYEKAPSFQFELTA
jgi:hypothetical protein